MMAGEIPITPPQAFLIATGITDATITSAINTLYSDLVTYGIWGKMKAIYPFVGGTATTHKFNLINPANTNAAFRLVFSGGWTHSANGALPNGTNAYAITFLSPNPVLTENDTHMAYYSRTNVIGPQVEIGIITPARFAMYASYSGDFGSDNYSNWVAAKIQATNLDSKGFYVSTRTSAIIHKAFKNNLQIGTTNTNNGGSMSGINIPVFIGASNANQSPLYFSSKEVAFASIGDGLTDTEAFNFYTAVQAFQTTLGRQV